MNKRETNIAEDQATVYLVGAGPGDPELLTLKAVRVLNEAEVVLHDALVSASILEHCSANAEIVPVGKKKGRHSVIQEKILDLLLSYSKTHKRIVRLKGGDPLIFARAGEEIEWIVSKGLRCVVVPGISAAQGAAASLQIPLTHRRLASSLGFHTGHGGSAQSGTNFAELDLSHTTHVVFMALSVLETIVEELLASKPQARWLPAAVVSCATLATQQVIAGRLCELSARVAEEKLQTPAILIIGQVVASSPLLASDFAQISSEPGT